MRAATAYLVLVLAATAASCGSADRDRVLTAYDGTCDAFRLAADGSTSEAEATFQDEAHEGLHLLAERLIDIDRAVAADLLEAKQRVEADLLDDPDGDLVADLAQLIEQTRRAVERLGVDQPPECT